MKTPKLLLAAAAAGSLALLNGCGGGDKPTTTAPEPVDTTESAPADQTATAPSPVPPSVPAAQPAPEQQVPQTPEVVQAQQYLQKGAEKILQEMETAPAPATERERFERNMNWVVIMKDGDARQRAEARRQIRDAGLSREEARELQELFRMYGVRP